MSKPDWKAAPLWAQFLAQDRNGAWYWYDNCPSQYRDDPYWAATGSKAGPAFVPNWHESLETRPVPVEPVPPAKTAPLLTREQFRLIIDASLLAKTMQENSIVSDRFMKAGKRLDEIERLLCGD